MVAGAKDLAYKRMFTLFGMPGKVDTEEIWESIGQYGLGTKRTLEQYQEFIGVNLTTLEVGVDVPSFLSRAELAVGVAVIKQAGRRKDLSVGGARMVSCC